jgi:hypothetical protein
LFNRTDGSVIPVSDDANAVYYAKPARPADIIVNRSVGNPRSADLRNAPVKLAQCRRATRLILSGESRVSIHRVNGG